METIHPIDHSIIINLNIITVRYFLSILLPYGAIPLIGVVWTLFWAIAFGGTVTSLSVKIGASSLYFTLPVSRLHLTYLTPKIVFACDSDQTQICVFNNMYNPATMIDIIFVIIISVGPRFVGSVSSVVVPGRFIAQ